MSDSQASASTFTFGIRRLVLVDSAGFCYVEIPVDNHGLILGPGNLGKSSLLNSLRLFLLPENNFKNSRKKFAFRNASAGSFYTNEESFQHYFPSQFSFLIMEAENPAGSHCQILYRDNASQLSYGRAFVPVSYDQLRPLFWNGDDEDGIGQAVPESLRGAPAATAMQSLNDFSFSGGDKFVQSLEQLYGGQTGVFGARARDTFNALGRIRELHAKDYSPANGADYGGDRFARELRLAAQLIKARVGVEAITIDLGGWDSHLSQGPLISPLMRRLANGLAAFRRDLGAAMRQTTVVVMSEFGRRVSENSALGTDHGRGGAMFVLGGDGAEGRVIADWPGLKRDALVGPGDLPVTTDFRDVLIPVLRRHAPGVDMARVFPGHKAKPLAQAAESA